MIILILLLITGTQSITCWGDMGKYVCSLRPGQWILLTDLWTFSHDSYLYVNARHGQKVYVCKFAMTQSLYSKIHIYSK